MMPNRSSVAAYLQSLPPHYVVPKHVESVRVDLVQWSYISTGGLELISSHGEDSYRMPLCIAASVTGQDANGVCTWIEALPPTGRAARVVVNEQAMDAFMEGFAIVVVCRYSESVNGYTTGRTMEARRAFMRAPQDGASLMLDVTAITGSVLAAKQVVASPGPVTALRLVGVPEMAAHPGNTNSAPPSIGASVEVTDGVIASRNTPSDGSVTVPSVTAPDGKPPTGKGRNYTILHRNHQGPQTALIRPLATRSPASGTVTDAPLQVATVEAAMIALATMESLGMRPEAIAAVRAVLLPGNSLKAGQSLPAGLAVAMPSPPDTGRRVTTVAAPGSVTGALSAAGVQLPPATITASTHGHAVTSVASTGRAAAAKASRANAIAEDAFLKQAVKSSRKDLELAAAKAKKAAKEERLLRQTVSRLASEVKDDGKTQLSSSFIQQFNAETGASIPDNKYKTSEETRKFAMEKRVTALIHSERRRGIYSVVGLEFAAKRQKVCPLCFGKHSQGPCPQSHRTCLTGSQDETGKVHHKLELVRWLQQYMGVVLTIPVVADQAIAAGLTAVPLLNSGAKALLRKLKQGEAPPIRPPPLTELISGMGRHWCRSCMRDHPSPRGSSCPESACPNAPSRKTIPRSLYNGVVTKLVRSMAAHCWKEQVAQWRPDSATASNAGAGEHSTGGTAATGMLPTRPKHFPWGAGSNSGSGGTVVYGQQQLTPADRSLPHQDVSMDSTETRVVPGEAAPVLSLSLKVGEGRPSSSRSSNSEVVRPPGVKTSPPTAAGATGNEAPLHAPPAHHLSNTSAVVAEGTPGPLGPVAAIPKTAAAATGERELQEPADGSESALVATASEVATSASSLATPARTSAPAARVAGEKGGSFVQGASPSASENGSPVITHTVKKGRIAPAGEVVGSSHTQDSTDSSSTPLPGMQDGGSAEVGKALVLDHVQGLVAVPATGTTALAAQMVASSSGTVSRPSQAVSREMGGAGAATAGGSVNAAAGGSTPTARGASRSRSGTRRQAVAETSDAASASGHSNTTNINGHSNVATALSPVNTIILSGETIGYTQPRSIASNAPIAKVQTFGEASNVLSAKAPEAI